MREGVKEDGLGERLMGSTVGIPTLSSIVPVGDGIVGRSGIKKSRSVDLKRLNKSLRNH